MITFSDIPEFIIDRYLEVFNQPYSPVTYNPLFWDEVTCGDNSVCFVSDVFTFDHGIGQVFFKNYEWLANINDYSEYSLGVRNVSVSNVRIVGPNSVIMSKGNNRIPVFAEMETEYKEIYIIPELSPKFENPTGIGTFYNFTMSQEKYPVPSDVIRETISQMSSGTTPYMKYQFIKYDCFANPYYKNIDPAEGQKIYFQKSGFFYDWGKEYSDIDDTTGFEIVPANHINFNKDYTYFGQIYPYGNDETKCRIFLYQLKDIVVNSLPEHNRTDKLKEFINIGFDQIYSKIFNQQKNMKTLYNPYEVESRFIERLNRGMYDVDIDLYNLSDEDRVRDLTSNMPILLKKKGTYSSFISVWKFITGFDAFIDTSDINIYEWWHETNPAGVYDVTEYDEVNYTNVYETTPVGCSKYSYYKRYSADYPEFYHTSLTPIVADAYIHKQTSASTSWVGKHWINDNSLLIQCFSTTFQEIIPKSILINDKSQITIEFSEAIAGYAVFSKVSYGQLKKGHHWDINHYINRKNVLVQSFSESNERFSPRNIYKKNYDSEVLSISTSVNQDGYGYFVKGDYIFHNRTDLSTWEVTHNLNVLLLCQCYDEDHNQINPKNVDQSNFNKIVITFNQPTKGYVILKRIGRIDQDLEGYILSPHFKVEMDLTCRPLESNAILSESLWNSLYNSYEIIRPITRVSHYHFVFSPETDW
jgi:hypothetical protein